MERFVRVPYVWYQGYGNTLPLGQPGLSRHNQANWRQNMGPPTFLARPGLLVPANASEYCMDPYRRAHFKAILTQMNPNLSLRLCKANTKEVGVQVSLQVDRSVQCSLGPQTLHSCCPWDNTGHRECMTAWGVSSPVIGHRSLIHLRKDGEDGKNKVVLGPGEASQQPPPMPRSEDERQEGLPQSKELVEEDVKCLSERKSKQVQGDATGCPLQKPSFQFLEPKYGYFHCKDCKTRWESAYVWCISGTNKVYFKQLCCKCQKSFNPYRVEAIQCQTCSKSRCSCPQKKRHIDLRRPHRQELCGRCKDKKFSCGNISNFKYMI
ncbi:ZAR1-like protein [Heterocephalus glaber]|uniref:ZAR1-like protein n=1 Tax=Heterocephalus glaber TaxID=10181 RepID=A0AAX6PL22_HETGA|nr:ZAR1-like protein [Heterocephalus glaber]